MNTFKFRSETAVDILNFLAWLTRHKTNLHISELQATNDNDLPDQDVTFKANKTYEQIIQIMLKADADIGDLHVMYESLNYADKYTGKRSRDIESDLSLSETQEKPQPYKYKLRYEVFNDIYRLLAWLTSNTTGLKISDIQIDAKEDAIILNANKKYKQFLKILFKADDDIGDLHIIYQTLNYINDFTGDRNYDIREIIEDEEEERKNRLAKKYSK